ncbi:hypothetical protein BGX31_003133 [Mortierella sp. GBA43]|nr:hypothetical protein BGX31_003133 [Mortierella sp. GBA43]
MNDYDLKGNDFVIPPGSVNESNIMSYESQIMAHIERQRRSRHTFVEPQIRLLEAIGLPAGFGCTDIPWFYKHAHGIQLDQLSMFTDCDTDRLDYGEGDGMQAFLRRCDHLQDLILGCGSKDLLTWAAVDALTAAGYSSEISSTGLRFQQIPNGFTSPSPGPGSLPSQTSRLLCGPRPSGILPNLKSLELDWDGSHQFVVHALNDAMVAFAGTLCTIVVHGYGFTEPWDDEWDALSIMAQRRVRMSKPLEDEPWANTIGGGPGQVLPFPLLQLRSLLIHLGDTLDIQIGSFEQCPNLESLVIRYGSVSQDELGNGKTDIVSVSQSDDGSIRARISLFPTWNFPRLRELELHHLAALRFDWESLSNMPQLERLEARVEETILDWYTPSHYIEDQKDFWKSKMDLKENDNRNSDNSNNNKDLVGLDSRNPKWWTWPLPLLRTMILDGHPVALFYWNWIQFCPNLDDLSLTLQGYVHHIPRLSPLASSSPPSSEPLPNLDDPNGQPANDWKEQQQPLLHSRLAVISIGPNLMSDHDLQTLLTIYAPFLNRIDLQIEWGFEHPAMMTPFQFLKVVQQADHINRSYAETLTVDIQTQGESHNKTNEDNNNATNALEQEKHRQRLGTLGTALTTVNCRTQFDLDSSEIQQLGLVEIRYEEQIFQDRNMRVYRAGYQSLVAQGDYDLIHPVTESDHLHQDD